MVHSRIVFDEAQIRLIPNVIRQIKMKKLFVHKKKHRIKSKAKLTQNFGFEKYLIFLLLLFFRHIYKLVTFHLLVLLVLLVCLGKLDSNNILFQWKHANNPI